MLIYGLKNGLGFLLMCAGLSSKDGNKEEDGLSSKVSTPSDPPTPRTEGEILKSSNMKSFNFSELKTATRNFRPDSVVGEGRFGCVFKGWIDELLIFKNNCGLVERFSFFYPFIHLSSTSFG